MDFEQLRLEFPQLNQKVGDYNLIYLDSAATSLKPNKVIQRLTSYYTNEVSNVHRGAHHFSNLATENYENCRKNIAQYLQAEDDEIVFTSGTTDGINLLAYALDPVIEKNKSETKNEILLTQAEHHSNIVPWYWFAKRHGLKLKVLPVNEQGEVEDLENYLTSKTFLVACVHMSNTLGSLIDIESICKRAKEIGAYSVVDAAQSISYMNLSVKKIDCDFLSFSSHKLFGPEGLGVLYGRSKLLNSIGFYKGGGSMISDVAFDEIKFLPSPQKFEAGTPSIGAVIAFNEALDFFKKIPKAELQAHEKTLVHLTHRLLSEIPGYQPLGSLETKKNILSFNLKDCHPSDLGSLINEMGVAVRVGHHCTQPLLKAYKIDSILRVSFSIYNNEKDVYAFVKALKKARELLL